MSAAARSYEESGRDWEIVMLPPVNRVLPVSRRRLLSLMRRFGDAGGT